MEFYRNRQLENPFFYYKLRKFLAFFKGSGSHLELGCGQGDYLWLAQKAGLRAKGLELSRELAKACRSRGLDVEQGEALAFLRRSRAGTYDSVYCSNVLEHLEPMQLEGLLDLLAAKLPKGGRFAASTANPESLGLMSQFWNDITHVRLYPARSLKEMLEARGFEVLAAGEDEDTRSQNPLRVLARVLRRVLVGPYFGPPEIYVMAVKKG